jgi:hypothetical protein
VIGFYVYPQPTADSGIARDLSEVHDPKTIGVVKWGGQPPTSARTKVFGIDHYGSEQNISGA